MYRGEIAEKNICDYALFISFFPQLVAGPIERASNMLSQIKELKNLKININNIYVDNSYIIPINDDVFEIDETGIFIIKVKTVDYDGNVHEASTYVNETE
ncbi:MAG: hypothetical protein MJZ11_06715 [Lachnospiraceae bacterium]|nr:hypothetical protein [Lachnospiraceae bacterium]